jgi:hypothetical protein
MRHLTSIILLLLLFSCSKYKKEIQSYEISGDYEWFYSYEGPFNSLSNQQVEDKYGIRIKDSGKVIFYKNGEQVDKYRIVSVVKLSEGVEVIYKIDKFSNGILTCPDDGIKIADWPFDAYINEFQKVSK